MAKSTFQIIKFLEQYSFKSELDWKGISGLCKLELDVNLDIDPKFSEDGINFADFSSWYSEGFGSGDIANLDGNLVMIGSCNLITTKIEATLVGDKINTTRSSRKYSDLVKPSDSDIVLFKRILSENGLQFGEEYETVIERHIPIPGERISFKTDSCRGIGVIRSVSKEANTFELYCYYTYDTGDIGYSMHETIGLLSDYVFQCMTRSERNRLQNELKKRGKSWNDKMRRVEPIDGKAKLGEKYWYINDKVKMVFDIEEGKPTSHFRFLGGNYFLTQDDCLENLGAINEILRDFLAR